MKDVFETVSDWRIETANDNERNTKRVIKKLAVAAAALGWPEQIVDSARAQMQSVAEIQIRAMDQMMDVWEEQLKNPSTPYAMFAKTSTSPNFGSAAANPLQFWMQSAEQWQKLWTDALTSFLEFMAGKPQDGAQVPGPRNLSRQAPRYMAVEGQQRILAVPQNRTRMLGTSLFSQSLQVRKPTYERVPC